MNKLTAFAVIAALLFSCNNNTGKGVFTLEGEIPSHADEKIYLEELYFNGKQPEVLDTGEIKNGKFSLTAVAPEEGMYRIRTEKGENTIFINDGEKIQFMADPLSPEPMKGTFSGSANSSLKKLIGYIDSVGLLLDNKYRLLEAFTKASVKSDDSIFIATYNEFTNLQNNVSKYVLAYADSAKSPVLSLFALNKAPLEIGKFEAPLSSLAKRFPKHKGIAGALDYVKKLAAQNQAQNQTQAQPVSKPAVGDMAPELAMNDVDGKPVSLSQLRGKYVLIDFWASWCAPCRDENPNIVAAFNRFKDKNFTVLSVSLDDNKQAWINAIKDDKLNWQHISDLKKWNTAAVPLYGFDGIPYNVLIDPQGKIIAADLRGNALQNKLQEVLK